MSRGNLAIVNTSGGELSPLVYGRIDLPVYQKGLEWQKNFFSLPQGASKFRNAWKNVHNTKSHGKGELIKFEFNNSDTYLLSLQDNVMRVYRDTAPVLETAKNITAITKANPGVLTITGHGFATGDEIFITGVGGMTDISEQFYLAQYVNANTITLKDTFGNAVDTTNFQTYTSGGTAAKVFEFAMPYEEEDLEKVHYTQSADTIHFACANYPPFSLTRRDHTKWYVNTGVLQSPAVITNITKANPGVFTTQSEHGLAAGDKIWITDVLGMTEVNNALFAVNSTPTTTTFTVATTTPVILDTSGYTTYASGGVVFKRIGRTSDPFKQTILADITKANPGVFTVQGSHGVVINDEVYIAEVKGMTEVNNKRYFVNTVPSAGTFTLKDANGTPLNTTSFTTFVTGGTVTPIKYCPKTVTFLQEARKAYGGWPAQPDGLAFSRAPDSATGATRFEDFTTGANDTDSIRFTLASIFNTLEAILWMGTSGDQLVIGTTGSIRRIQGVNKDAFITPSSIKAPAVNNVGATSRQPVSNGRSLYYVEDTGKSIRSFAFDFQSDSFSTVDQNLVTDNLARPGFKKVLEQRGRPDMVWALRNDGVLAGMTFKESENIYAWHRHEAAGQSRDTDNNFQPWGKILSIAIVPRANNTPRLWAIIEREFNGVTSRYIEYLSDPASYEIAHSYFSNVGYDNQVADLQRFNNSRWEMLKDDVYVDSALTYDGRLVGGSITITPGATTGASVTFTASSSFFNSAMVGRQIIKPYSRWGYGGGVAKITGYTSGTQVTCEILSDFDNTNVMAAGQWIITTDTLRGLRLFNGQTVRVQADGGDIGDFEVSNGVLSLGKQCGIVHVGLPYKGLYITMNMDVAGVRGTAQSKIRRVVKAAMRLFASLGFKIGTTPWNAKDVVLRVNEDPLDRPEPLFDGVFETNLEDVHSRDSKQICIVKDSATPLTILSLDAEVEVVDA